MTYSEELWTVYKDIAENVPLYDNPFLDESLKRFEVLITCRCYATYRIMVNSFIGCDDLDIHCRNCGRSIGEARSYSQHSGGVFNSTMFRLNTDKERAMSQPNGT